MIDELHNLNVKHVLKRLFLIFHIELLEFILNKQQHHPTAYELPYLIFRSAAFDRVRLDAILKIDYELLEILFEGPASGYEHIILIWAQNSCLFDSFFAMILPNFVD